MDEKKSKKRFTVSLPDPLYQFLAERSDEIESNISQAIRIMVRNEMKQNEGKNYSIDMIKEI